MPKVPQILAEGGTIGTTSPPRMPLGQGTDLSGLTTFAHGIQEAARGYGHAQEVARREAAVVAKQMATLEAENALNEAQRTFADRQIAIGMDPSITPQKYSQAVDNALRATQQGYEKGLTSPDSKYMFAKGFGDFSRAKSIEGKYEAVERGKSFVRAGTTLANREDINIAVNAPDGPDPNNPGQLRNEAVRRIENRYVDLLQTKNMTGAEVDTHLANDMAAIAEGRVVKSWDNIKERTVTAHLLRTGQVPHLTVQKQRQLLDNLGTKEREERAARKEEQKEFLDKQEQEAERMLTDSVRNKKWDLARQIMVTHGQFFKGTRYEHWSDTIVNREMKRGPSDQDAKTQSQLEVWSVTNDPVAVKEMVDGFYRVGRLDDEDYRIYAGHLVSRINQKTAGDPSLERRHRQTEENLKEALRFNGAGAAILNSQAQGTLSIALEDLSRNSSYFAVQGRRGNTEDPFDWLERRKTFYMGQVGSIANQRRSLLQSQARDGNGVRMTFSDNSKVDMQALNAKRSTFRDHADYLDQIRVLEEYYNLGREMDRLQRTSQPGVPEATPTPMPTPSGAAAPTGQQPKTYNRPQPKKE